MSRSCTAMSLKMPPPPLTYSNGGGAGSREQSLMTIGSPTSPLSSACLMRAKFGSKRRCSAVISLTPASLQQLIASIVSSISVATGFSQKTCLPAAAHALIWSAWNCDGEQIHTASTSGLLMTSIASAVNEGSLYFSAAACALEMVGLEMMIGLAFSQLASASRCTMPMRPAPMMPTLITCVGSNRRLGWPGLGRDGAALGFSGAPFQSPSRPCRASARPAPGARPAREAGTPPCTPSLEPIAAA